MQSIQSYFASIQIEQVCLYLHRAGWTKSLNGGRIDFEKAVDQSEETSRVFLPASTSHPRYRRLLPNLIFSVSILEEREAIEVACDIAGLPTAEAAHVGQPAPTPGKIGHVVLRNSSAQSIEIRLAAGSGSYQLPAGEELLVAQSESDCLLELSSATSLQIGPSRVLLGVPTPASQELAVSLRSWFADCFPALTSAGEAVPETGSEAEKLLVQFCFAVESLANLVEQPAPLLRASAVLLSGVSQLLPDSSEAQLELFQLARQLLCPARLTFELQQQLTYELWQVSRADQPLSPQKTLAWLNRKALSASGTTRPEIRTASC